MLVGLAYDGESAFTDTEIAAHFFLWAFAKAPLILPAVENMKGNTRAIISNPYVIGVNQDLLGNPAKCVIGCGTSFEVYQSLVMVDEKEGVYMGVLAVNWDDKDAYNWQWTAFDLGFATSKEDICTQ